MTRAQLQMKEAALKPWRKLCESVTLALPFPPSLNNLFRDIPRVGRVQTKEYIEWRRFAGLEISRQRSGRVAGRVELSYAFEEQFTTANHLIRVIDLDGLFKAPTDLLVKMGVIDGDHQDIVRKITGFWCAKTRGCVVEIKKADIQVMPGFAPIASDETNEDRGGGSGNPPPPSPPSGPNLHTFIQGLLSELPKSVEVWPDAKRKLWLSTAESIFKMIYKDEEP